MKRESGDNFLEIMQEGSLIGKYRIESYLGGGGAGRVYRAVQGGPGGFNRAVAIKTMRHGVCREEELRQIFAREARIIGLFSHRNIVQVYDFAVESDDYYLVMEFIDGLTLRQLLARAQQKPPLRLRLHLAHEIAQGLKYAHQLRDQDGELLGVIHRDIKPANIMISTQGEVKITDFGLAKLANDVGDRLSRIGTVRGTPGYMSPEQKKGGIISQATDIYSFCAVLWELFCFQSLSQLYRGQQKRLEDLLDAEMIDVPDLPALELLLRRGFHPDPRQRPDAIQMAENLRTILHQHSSKGVTTDANDELATLVRQLQSEVPSEKNAQSMFVTPTVDVAAHAKPQAAFAALNVDFDISTSPEDHLPPLLEVGSSIALPSRLSAMEPPKVEERTKITQEGKQNLSTEKSSMTRLKKNRWPLAIFILLTTIGLAGAALWTSGRFHASLLTSSIPVSVDARTESSSQTTLDARIERAALTVTPLLDKEISSPHTMTTQTRTKSTRPKHFSASAPPHPSAAAKSGFISVNAAPWAKVFLDGQSIGLTPLLNYPVSAGGHQLKLLGPNGRVAKRRVIVPADGHLNLGLQPFENE